MENLSSLQIVLLKKGVINLQGNVDGDMFAYVRGCLTLLSLEGNPPIQINITSGGGSLNHGLIIYDILRLYPGKKTGTIIGYARSIALIILQACDKRESTRHSFSLLHYVSRSESDLDEIENKKKWENIVKDMRADQQKIYLILKKKTRKPLSAIVALCKEGRDLSAREALDFGLIDKII